MTETTLTVQWNRLDETTPLPNELTYPVGTLGALINNLSNNFGDVGSTFTDHFTAKNPHNIWEKQSKVITDDYTINGDYNETIIKCIGSTSLTITLDDGAGTEEDALRFVDGNLIVVDNVYVGAGTLTIKTISGDIVIDKETSSPEITLTGKGQVELVFFDGDWLITNIKD